MKVLNEMETEQLTERINKALIERHKAVNPSLSEQWSMVKAYFQKHHSTLSREEQLRITAEFEAFMVRHIWVIQDLEVAEINPWERLIVPGWNQTKEGKACIAFAKRGSLIGNMVKSAVCPMCDETFEQVAPDQQPIYKLYSMGRFAYSCALVHYMEAHSARPWDLDFITAAVKWNKVPIKTFNWRTWMLKKYSRSSYLGNFLSPL